MLPPDAIAKPLLYVLSATSVNEQFGAIEVTFRLRTSQRWCFSRARLFGTNPLPSVSKNPDEKLAPLPLSPTGGSH
jgi:hypothetical protein